jgi:hypothetical protein
MPWCLGTNIKLPFYYNLNRGKMLVNSSCCLTYVSRSESRMWFHVQIFFSRVSSVKLSGSQISSWYTTFSQTPDDLLGGLQTLERRDSSVGIATGYGLDDKRSRSSSPGKVKSFLLSTPSRPVLGSTQSPFKLVQGALSPGVKRPGRDVDHSPSISTEVKKTWIYTSTPSHVFIAWCLIS